MKLEDFLKDRLNNGEALPGFQAQRKMGPERLDGSYMHDIRPPEDSRTNAVLLLMYEDLQPPEYHILLTIRSGRMPSHAGEISCPGGGIEPGETPVEAALRETKEEVGIPADKIRIAGGLSQLYIPVTNNIIHPFVGFATEKPAFRPDPAEVSGILTPKLKDLTNPENIRRDRWELGAGEFDVPFWNLFDIPLWGATAMILSEFVDILKERQY